MNLKAAMTSFDPLLPVAWPGSKQQVAMDVSLVRGQRSQRTSWSNIQQMNPITIIPQGLTHHTLVLKLHILAPVLSALG